MDNGLVKHAIHTIDPECVRKKSNWSKGHNKFKFDDETFDPKLLLENIQDYSPKLNALMTKIADLDRRDREIGNLWRQNVGISVYCQGLSFRL